MQKPTLRKRNQPWDSDGQHPLRLYVRLYPGVHDTLIADLLRASPGLRSTRVISLMTIGLMQERAHPVARAEDRKPSTRDTELAAEDLEFTASIVESSAPES